MSDPPFVTLRDLVCAYVQANPDCQAFDIPEEIWIAGGMHGQAFVVPRMRDGVAFACTVVNKRPTPANE